MSVCVCVCACSWEGAGEEEKGLDKATGKVRIEVDPKYYRPTEVVSSSLVNSPCNNFIDHGLMLNLLYGDPLPIP